MDAASLGGDIFALPFPDASFDAVFSHHVLQHVRDPLAGLREFHCVLRPGGVVGVRDPDEGATLFAPATPLLVEARELEMRLRRHLGSDPTYARNQRRLLLEAGFVRPEARAAVRAWGTPSLARESAAGWRKRLAGPSGDPMLVAVG